MSRHRALLLGALALCFAKLAAAGGPVTYSVTVNTSSIAGTTGSLDFNFNPGPLVSQSASLQILSFASNGGTLVGGAVRTGDANGALPATVTFDNQTAFNDYFQAFKFGSTFSFQVTLSGPALTSPDGGSTSGSTFAFSMFSDAAGTIPALTTDATNGFAFTVNVNLDGTTTATNFSSQTSINSTTIPSTPVPSSISLVTLGLLLAGLWSLAARRTGGLPKTLALAGLLLLPFGSDILSAQAPGHSASGSSSRLLTGAHISTKASGLAYSRSTQTFNGTVTITNISGRAITGPFHIVLNSLTPGVTLRNATNSFQGAPYITVPGVSSLAPGESASINVQFKNPSNARINFTPGHYSGSITNDN